MPGLNDTLGWLAYWWHRLTTSRYVLYLEQRVDFLERQNEALNRTVWGLKGFPVAQVERVGVGGPTPEQVAASAQPKPQRTIRGRPSWPQIRARLEQADLKKAHETHRERLEALHQQLIAARAKQQAGQPAKPNGSGGDDAASG